MPAIARINSNTTGKCRIGAVLCLAGLSMAGIFALDLTVPHVMAGGMPYMAVVLFALCLPWTIASIALASVATLLVINGYFLSLTDGNGWTDPAIRALAVAATWITAVLVAKRMAAERSLGNSNALLQTLIEATFDGVIIVDGDGIVRAYNSESERLFGLVASEVLGRNVGILMPPRYRDTYDGYLKKYRLTGSANIVFTGREVVGQRRDDSTFAMDLTLSEALYQGKPAFVALIRNVARRNLVDSAWRQVTRLEALGQLASGVVHDFHNVLFPISIITSVVRNRLPADSEERKNLENVLLAVERGKKLTEQILMFVQHKSDERRPVAVSTILDECLEFLRAVIPARIEIRSRIGRATGFVYADASQIYEVCMNLGTNAAHAIGPEGGVLEFDLRRLDVKEGRRGGPDNLRPGPYVKVTVRDTGHGMDQATTKRAFEPRFSKKPAGESTGMGLAVVKEIVAGHGGVVDVSSEPGRGTIFEVYFPAIQGS